MGKSKVPPPGWGSDKGLKRVFGRLRSMLFAKEYTAVRRVALIAFSVVLVGVTFALRDTTTNQEVNKFGVGKTSVTIIEENVDPTNPPIPWDPDSKHVQLQLGAGDDIVPSLVRAIIVPIVRDDATGNITEGHFGPLTEPVGNQVEMMDIIYHFNSNWSSNWLYKDGYFYYKKVLNANEITELLLEGVTLSGSADSAYYADKQVYIEVYADAIQSQAADDWGLKVDNSGNVTIK